MEAVDWLGVGLGELIERLVGFTAAGGEHRCGSCQSQQTDGERGCVSVAGKDRRGLGPATEDGQSFGRERVEVAGEARDRVR